MNDLTMTQHLTFSQITGEFRGTTILSTLLRFPGLTALKENPVTLLWYMRTFIIHVVGY
jgi:hypothetical protein